MLLFGVLKLNQKLLYKLKTLETPNPDLRSFNLDFPRSWFYLLS